VDCLRSSFRGHLGSRTAVGPVLAAQFGYLPGTLWILIGVVIGGAVQDFVILFVRCDATGNRSAKWIKEELNALAGCIGLAAILAIMVILLAVLALVVVKALAESPGASSRRSDNPDRLVHGRLPSVLARGQGYGGSAIGVVLLLLRCGAGSLFINTPNGPRSSR
jgi:carbon starvation protein